MIGSSVHAPRKIVAAALLAALALVVASTFADAAARAVPLTNLGTFGSPGSGAGQLSEPQGVAVNDVTGDVYVADSGNNRVDEFDAQGNFVLAFGTGVDQTTGEDVCTAASGDTCKAGSPGSREGEIKSPYSIAIDNSNGRSAGDVYVTHGGVSITGRVVSKFSSSGGFISVNTGRTVPNATGDFGSKGILSIAVDPRGDLWLYSAGAVFQFNQDGQYLNSWETVVQGSTSEAGIAVDGAHVFLIDDIGRVVRYSLAGRPEGYVTAQEVLGQERVTQMALDSATDDLYTNAAHIEHYDAACVPVSMSAVLITQNISGCSPADRFSLVGVYSALGLNPETTTLYATMSAAGQVGVFGPPSPGTPVVDSEQTMAAASVSASVSATVTPLGFAAHCQVQYVDDPGYQGSGYSQATTVPCARADLGAGFADQPASAWLTGLAAGTAYHYRFVVSSSAGTADGADRTLTTESPTQGLPDNRAYELVTPADKESLEPYIFERTPGPSVQAGVSGDGVTFYSPHALPGSAFAGGFYVATRGVDAWSSQNLIPPQSSELFGGCSEFVAIEAYASDLSKGLLADGFGQLFGCGHDEPRLVPGEPQGVENLFVHDNTTGAYELVSLNPVAGSPSEAHYDASSADLGHVVFDESAQLTPDAPAGEDNLYDWSNGSVRLVTTLPGAAVPHGPAQLHAVSTDGTRIVFQAAGGLYVRENDAQTVQADASHGAGPGGGGRFQIASADGSQVFFTDDAAAGLTSDTVPGSGENLYRFDVESGQLTDLTPAGNASVRGTSGAGEDGAYVYFVADGALASGATEGQPNLYVYHGGHATFIATFEASVIPEDCNWRNGANPCMTARVSADGTHIAFDSARSLTAFDTAGFTEVYLYDTPAGRLVCASCSPEGVRPDALAHINSQTIVSVFLERETSLSRNLSPDGSRLFFDTSQTLVAGDTNERQDVYEYEQAGTGSCHAAGGCTFLISGGGGSDDSFFLDASASGNDVFIATHQRLTPQDTDGVTDIYDVRVNGGLSQPPMSAPCGVEECRGQLSGGPVFAQPGSATSAGPGNLAPTAPSPSRVLPAPRAKGQTQKLKRAIRACRGKPKRKHKSCEANARRRYALRGGVGQAAAIQGKGGKR